MATIDEILDAMPEEDAETGRDYLVIDPLTRTIIVPGSEMVFGVTGDELADRKYFMCPRYVGDGLDLAGMFIRVNYRNAGGDEDGYLVDDVAVVGDYVTFSWRLWPKVTEYMGTVHFGVCADLPNTAERRFPDWNTTMATGEVLEGLHPYDGAVEEETRDVVTQLRAETAAQAAAVTACGAEQVQAVKDTAATETAAAVAAIKAQGAATQASLPADYTALAAQVDKLTRDRAAAIVCQAEGAAIQVQDASNDPLQGLRIFGRSTQDGTPTPEAPVEIVSLPAPVVGVYSKNLLCADSLVNGQFVKNADGTYTLTKNGTGGLRFSNRAACNLPKGTYTMSVRSVAGVDDTVRIAVTYANGAEHSLAITVATPKTFDAPDSIVKLAAYLPADTDDGSYTTMGGLMLEHGTKATEYEPYKALQTLTITTPGSLPGIPVSSGGNYTDANGQEWICDEVDLARGVYVQRIYMESCALGYDASGDRYTGSTSYSANKNCVEGSGIPVLCNILPFHSQAANGTDTNGIRISASGPSFIAARYNDVALPEVTLSYPLATPIEHALTDAEVQAFRTLHSVKPTTTVLNDAGAHMALEYAADPKLYIDNKLAALVAANN